MSDRLPTRDHLSSFSFVRHSTVVLYEERGGALLLLPNWPAAGRILVLEEPAHENVDYWGRFGGALLLPALLTYFYS
jgi:hypothetical protein